jgi:hypothetical protein
MKRHVRPSKYDPRCDEVELIEAGPTYANVKLQNGTVKNVSLRHLAPLPARSDSGLTINSSDVPVTLPEDRPPVTISTDSIVPSRENSSSTPADATSAKCNNFEPRRSSRNKIQTEFYQAGVD